MGPALFDIKTKSAYEAWRSADAQARQLEGQLAAAWIAYHTGQGQVPSEALMTAVSGARAFANEKLNMVLASLRAAALDLAVKHPSSRQHQDVQFRPINAKVAGLHE
jgi:hypothetical protein